MMATSILEVKTHWSGDDNEGRMRCYPEFDITATIISNKYYGDIIKETKREKNTYGVTSISGYNAKCYELSFKLSDKQEIYALMAPYNKDEHNIIHFYETLDIAKKTWTNNIPKYGPLIPHSLYGYRENPLLVTYELYKYVVNGKDVLKSKDGFICKLKVKDDDIETDRKNKGPIWRKEQIATLESNIFDLKVKMRGLEAEQKTKMEQLNELNKLNELSKIIKNQ